MEAGKENCQEILDNRLDKESYYFGRLQQSEQQQIFSETVPGSVVLIKFDPTNPAPPVTSTFTIRTPNRTTGKQSTYSSSPDRAHNDQNVEKCKNNRIDTNRWTYKEYIYKISRH